MACALSAGLSAQRSLAQHYEAQLNNPDLVGPERVEMQFQMGRALLSWDTPAALEASRATAREAQRQGRDDYVALALAQEARIAVSTLGAPAGVELMERASQRMPADADVELRGRLAIIEVGFYYAIDEYGLAAEALELALELAERSGSQKLMADCLLELHDLFYATDTGHEPAADLGRAEQLLTELGDERGLLRVRLRWVDVWMQQGREQEAEAALEDIIARAEATGDRLALLSARGHHFAAALDQGDFETAIELSLEDIETSSELGNDEILGWSTDHLAWTYLMAGRPEDAAPYVEQALAIAEHLELRALLSAVIESAAELARLREDGAAMLEFSQRQSSLAEAGIGRATRDVAMTQHLLREMRSERRELNEAAQRHTAALEETQQQYAARIASYRWAVLGLALVLTSAGSVLFYRGKRRAERMHDQLVEQTQHAQRTEEARKRLERQLSDLERLDGLGLLAAGFAHDFNNILCTIGGNAELLLGSVNGQQGHMAENIVQASRRASDLCTRLLDYARPSPSSGEVIDLRDVASDARTLLEAGGRGSTTVRLELGDTPLRAAVDRTAIEQVLINLVTNGLDPSVGASTLTIRLSQRQRAEAEPGQPEQGIWFGQPEPSNAYAVLEVLDDGRGLKEDVLRRVFDPFFTTKFEGRGLGLSAAYGIVKAHGGAFHVRSHEGSGTTFAAFLPLAEAPAPETNGNHVLRPAPRRAPGSTSGVLVVDDEAGVLSFLQNALAGSEHEVFLASSAPEALRLLEKHHTRIGRVLLDLSMPEFDGSELLAVLQAGYPELSVVVMSGHSESFIRDQIGTRRVAAVLRKPFGVGELLETVGVH